MYSAIGILASPRDLPDSDNEVIGRNVERSSKHCPSAFYTVLFYQNVLVAYTGIVSLEMFPSRGP